ncbi:LrgB family protein [Paucisalibacillus globulus]|uniref:LrgB family protein n=1 Tax=Paucisalibacillus globulus TaxID=351095 RepID=UPI00040E41A7|nr:LrgB family protein [Paucisalibacillus globulus]
MANLLTALIAVLATYCIYLFANKIHSKVGYTFTAPVITSAIVIIAVLLIFHIPYETYMIGGKWINELLGPAVVALAYPLYMQRSVLKKFITPILTGTIVGAIIGISSGILLAKLAGFEEVIIYSLTPKSVTTPVAMAIAEMLGGVTTLAAVFVMIAGIGGVLFSSIVNKVFKINHYTGKSVGIGSASHAIGTSKALESSQLEGSISTIAMVISATVVSIITPGLVALLV